MICVQTVCAKINYAKIICAQKVCASTSVIGQCDFGCNASNNAASIDFLIVVTSPPLSLVGVDATYCPDALAVQDFVINSPIFIA